MYIFKITDTVINININALRMTQETRFARKKCGGVEYDKQAS